MNRNIYSNHTDSNHTERFSTTEDNRHRYLDDVICAIRFQIAPRNLAYSKSNWITVAMLESCWLVAFFPGRDAEKSAEEATGEQSQTTLRDEIHTALRVAATQK